MEYLALMAASEYHFHLRTSFHCYSSPGVEDYQLFYVILYFRDTGKEQVTVMYNIIQFFNKRREILLYGGWMYTGITKYVSYSHSVLQNDVSTALVAVRSVLTATALLFRLNEATAPDPG